MKNARKIAAGITSMLLAGNMAASFPAAVFAKDVQTAEDVVTWLSEKVVADYGLDIGKEVDTYHRTSMATYTVDTPAVVPAAPEQSRFDLRDVDGKNYVSPVKSQDPFGTCWAFSATAAAEESVAYEGGFDFNSAPPEAVKEFDFSERHLAWFTANPLPENVLYPSQAGEGLFAGRAETNKQSDHYTRRQYNNLFFNTGGRMAVATTLYSCFCGPVLESQVPYRSEEGTIDPGMVILFEITEKPEQVLDPSNLPEYTIETYTTEEEYEKIISDKAGSVNFTNLDWYHEPGTYYWNQKPAPSPDATWAVDEDYRFNGFVELERSSLLPTPASEDENGAYRFDEYGLNAIKNELISGRAVSIAFWADKSRPGGDIKVGGFMNFVDENGNPTKEADKAAYWCHYTYDPEYHPEEPGSINKIQHINHAVTIVGYDDTIPKEYFYDPNGTIGGDGAFIVKNSWGSTETNGDAWGSGGSGYFYLSYYDQSLAQPESFDFSILTEEKVLKEKYNASRAEMYDLMPSADLDEISLPQKASMANVFTAKSNMQLRSVGYTAVTCNEEVNYDIYILNEDAKDPTDGVLAGHASQIYAYAGFQRTELDAPVTVREGQKYAVVVTVKREDGNYGIGVKYAPNEKGYGEILNIYSNMIRAEKPDITDEQLENALDEALKGVQYGKAVVNSGESYLFTDGTWADWADILEQTHNDMFGQYMDYDNFGIKTYSDTQILSLENEVKDPQKSYKAGDVVDCTLHVVNNTHNDLPNVEYYINEEKIGSADMLQSLEETEIDYQYTVTEEDVKNGKFRTDAKVFLQYEGTAKIEVNIIEDFNHASLIVPVQAEEPAETTEHPTEAAEQPTGATEQPAETTEQPTGATEQPAETTEQPATTPAAPAYSHDRLCEMAIKDYEVKSGVVPAHAELSVNTDGTVSIVLSDADGKVLSTYTVNPDTAKGSDDSGKVVDLPQTGNCSPRGLAAAATAAALTVTGAFFMLHSVLGKKKED